MLAAFMFAALGDSRGFDVITAILNDRSDRPAGQGIPKGRWSLQGQIDADRYYAVHLLGELKNPSAVPVLVAYYRTNR
jgi:HEAT repeat protein